VLRSLRIDNLVLIQQAELVLSPGLNALTGETGAGKTIFAHAIGLLLGTKGEAAAVGPAGTEAYVEAELVVPDGFWDDETHATLAELRPDDEEVLVAARRVFADGRTRAYAWGRAIAREDLAAATERLIAMSGQFEQRRLARPAYQLDSLDSFVGAEQHARRIAVREAWRALTVARKRLDALTHDAGSERARLVELEALVADTDGFETGEEESLRSERQRLRGHAELVEGTATAARALDPEDGAGATALADEALHALEPLEQLSPELASVATELRDLSERLREAGRELHSLVGTLEGDPVRLEQVEERLDRIATARRRFDATTLDELLERRTAALTELGDREDGKDPVEDAREHVEKAEQAYGRAAAVLGEARRAAAATFADAVAAELRDVGLGEGEFRVDVREREAGPSGVDEVVFSIKPNAGMGFGPVADTASGGELSRVALALAAVAGGETLVFDEIDAGIGGVTAHSVAEVLRRLATRAQVITITHLPQIASVADTHFSVEKVPGDPTRTTIEPLDETRRRDELERMLGGGAFVATALTTPKG
jgi:DNA repair protein RecN (Recombination protein N)